METARGASSPWIFFAPALILGCLSGCAGAPGTETGDVVGVEPAGATVGTRIYGGEVDDDPVSNSAVVALRVEKGTSTQLCTGALVAPNVVLTARHCVSLGVASQVLCDEQGRSRNGAHVTGDVRPSNVAVSLGPEVDFSTAPAARGKAVFRPEGDILCDTDIALVVLDRPLKNIQPLKIRVANRVVTGESIRSVGFGLNDINAALGTRLKKDAVEVLAVGPVGRKAETGRPSVGRHEFEVGKSICQGDSGGPAISEETGAIVGVVSRGGDCAIDEGHIYTSTAPFHQLFDAAFATAGASLLEEQDLGERTDVASASGSGEGDPAAARATEQSLASDTPADTSSGCSASPDRPNRTGDALVSAALAVLVLVGLGRTRSKSPAVVRIRKR
ncbi:MAG: trypsin-like serine protease [Polyangiaceae bacterium]